MRTVAVCSCLFVGILLFSCKEGNESPSEKELDPGPGVTAVDSAASYNDRTDDSVARITPKKITE